MTTDDDLAPDHPTPSARSELPAVPALRNPRPLRAKQQTRGIRPTGSEPEDERADPPTGPAERSG